MPRIFQPAALFLILAASALPSAAAEPWERPLPHMFPSHRGRLGIEIQTMTPELREHMKAPADRGLLVSRVLTGSPAERGGVAVGDVIVSVDGEPVRQLFDLVRRTARAPQGSKLVLGVVRSGKERSVDVVPEGEATPWVDPQQWGEWIEQGVQRGSEELRRQLEELERRLEELERRLEQSPPADPQKT